MCGTEDGESARTTWPDQLQGFPGAAPRAWRWSTTPAWRLDVASGGVRRPPDPAVDPTRPWNSAGTRSREGVATGSAAKQPSDWPGGGHVVGPVDGC